MLSHSRFLSVFGAAFACALLLRPAFAQIPRTPVDSVTAHMELLAAVSFNDWKMSPDLSRRIQFATDPSMPAFNDSGWETLRIGASVYPDSCWLRKTIVLPRTILGEPVRGIVRMLVSVDDYGYFYCNGKLLGHFPWNGEFVLTENGAPGDTFVIAIRAINTGGPLRLLRAELRTDGTYDKQQAIRDFALSLRVAQKLLSFDTYQTNARVKVDPGIDRSSLDRNERKWMYDALQNIAKSIDLYALERGEYARYALSVDLVRKELVPFKEFVANNFTLVFNSNAHIDAAWLWRSLETVEVAKNTFESVLNMMDSLPNFTYTQSQSVYYEWMKERYPDLFERIKKRIAEGRWEVTGGMYVEPDCNLPSGESWMRHLLYAKKFFKAETGIDVKLGWNPDSFGYNWNMPQMYRQAGIDAFVTQKIGWNERNVFPHRLFWWEGPDTSRILAYFPFDYVNEVTDPYGIVDWLRQYEANTGLRKMMVLFGVGDHGGGPTMEMLDRIERLKKLDMYPAIEYGTTAQYIDWLRTQNLSTLPVWKDELYLEYHQGTFTTQAAVKKANRQNEALLTNAEKFSSFASAYGFSYDRAALKDAWKIVMFNQFHDILPGSSITPVYKDAAETNAEAAAIGTHELNRALKHIAGRIKTTAKSGTPLAVFNPLSWQRTDLVTAELPYASDESYAVLDASGKEIPSQNISAGRYERKILFVAEQVPPMGYALYYLRKQNPSSFPQSLSAEGGMVGSKFYALSVDTVTGWVKSVIDKRNGYKEMLAGEGNRLQMLDDRPTAWDAWNIGLTGREFPVKFVSLDVVEQGPVRAVLRAKFTYRKPGTTAAHPTVDFPTTFFEQDIVLYDKLERIDFVTRVDWWEEKTMLKVLFPLAEEDTSATYEIPFGTIMRSTQLRNSVDSAQYEVASHRWADLSSASYGVSLLNRSKYGYDCKGTNMRLSLLRSPLWPDPTADRGKHIIEYALYPHSSGWREAGTVRKGYEYNNRLIPVIFETVKGELPASYSFAELSPANCVLTTVKKAEDEDAWIYQWYEAHGEETVAELRLPRAPKKALLSNFLEEEGTPVPFEKSTVKVTVKPNTIVVLKVYY